MRQLEGVSIWCGGVTQNYYTVLCDRGPPRYPASQGWNVGWIVRVSDDGCDWLDLTLTLSVSNLYLQPAGGIVRFCKAMRSDHRRCASTDRECRRFCDQRLRLIRPVRERCGASRCGGARDVAQCSWLRSFDIAPSVPSGPASRRSSATGRVRSSPRARRVCACLRCVGS
jgi:hypothetical protein